MADFPGLTIFPTAGLNTFDNKTSPTSLSVATAAGAWPAANRALYTPVLVEDFITVYQMAVIVGTQSGNLDIGIYREDGTRLVSAGSTAVAVAGVQVVDITDTTLTPGTYFLAMNVDNTTATFQRQASGLAAFYQACGIQQQAVGAIALPATATFANPASPYVPLVFASCMKATI